MKKSLPLISSLLLVLGALCSTQAATVTVTVNSNGGFMYATSSGSLLSYGSSVRVGYFDLSSPTVMNTLQTSDNYLQLNSLFTPLGENIANAGTVSQAGNSGQTLFINNIGASGHVFGSISNATDTYLASGTRLSVWVFNHSDPTQATEWGIFSASSGWEYPPSLSSSTLSTLELTSPSEAIRGEYNDANQQLRLDSVSAVPEPGSILMLAAACLTQIRRRRKEA